MMFYCDRTWAISSVSFSGGFLDGHRFDLSQGFNCAIGSRGTGKTTFLELVRFALGAESENRTAKKRIDAIVKGNLGGGRVQVEVRTNDGRTYQISRSPGEEPVVLDAQGEPTSFAPQTDGFFKVCVFSQNEIEMIADQPDSQLAMIDNFESERIASISQEIRTVRTELEVNAGKIIPLQKKRATIVEELSILPSIEEKLKGFQSEGSEDAAAINAAHDLKALRDRERRALGLAADQLRELYQQVQSTRGHIDDTVFTEEMLNGPNGEIFTDAVSELQESALQIDALFIQVLKCIETQGKSLVEHSGDLDLRHKKQEVAFQELLSKHQEAQSKAAERARLERRRNELTEKQRQMQQIDRQLEEFQSERADLLQQLSELRDERFQVRQEVANRINTELSDSIRVSISQLGATDGYCEVLESALSGHRLQHRQVSEQIAEALGPSELVSIVKEQDMISLIDKAGLSGERATKVMAALTDNPALFEIEVAELIDLPLIELNDEGIYKETSELSTGQKCTTILPILLLDRESPLLIDQPEDNLDNRYVCETIVESIRRVKKHRQLFFVTHNPNIPVLGDAERVFVMVSDGQAARKVAEGSVDDCRDHIITLLEGGEDAFRARGRRYAK